MSQDNNEAASVRDATDEIMHEVATNPDRVAVRSKVAAEVRKAIVAASASQSSTPSADAPKYTVAESHAHGAEMHELGYQKGLAAAQMGATVPRVGGPDEAKTIDLPEFRERLRGMGAIIAVNGEPYKRLVGYVNRFFLAHVAPQESAADTGADAAKPNAVAMLSGALNHARDALRYYAEQEHFVRHQPDEWDTVSGEPQNFYEDSANTATVEDGSVAKLALEDVAQVEAYASIADDVAAVPPAKAEGLSERIKAIQAPNTLLRCSDSYIEGFNKAREMAAYLAQQAKGASKP